MVDNIVINNVKYEIIDTREKMTVPDCFVCASNKIGRGHGEAKFYVGNDNDDLRCFFGGNGFTIKCLILKKDLLEYLKNSESEYKNPNQEYQKKNEMPSLLIQRRNKIENLSDITEFTLSEQTQIEGPRVYVNSADEIYKVIREISLPNISYLAAIKLRSASGEIVYYFKLFIDYFNEYENPYEIKTQIKTIEDSDQSTDAKNTLTKARIGQGKYRQELLEICPFCPITYVSDDRLLIASHIKPWAKSNDNEKIDPYNGFMFTPNVDLLFDRGFITFTNDKMMLASPWLSKMTFARLNIIPNKKYEALPVDGREKYLEYHRSNIFKH